MLDLDPEPDATPANTLDVPAWATWSDPGGDHAYTAEPDSGPLAGQTLMVYGSASTSDQERLIGLLTLDPVDSASKDCDTDGLS